MIMSYEEAKKYKAYANSTDELIKMCEDIVNAVTPEEGAKLYRPCITWQNHFESSLRVIKKAVAEAKRRTKGMENYNEKYSVPQAMIDYEEMVYIHDHCEFGLLPIQMQMLVENTFIEFRYRRSPKLRSEEAETERRLKQKREDIKKYTKPGESIGEAELAKRKARANPPQTSLSEKEIHRFDRMSEKWLVRWCHFSYNWYWVVPCLLLCIVANGGLVSAIGLILFMICGELYSMRVQEYCGVILPWYVRADIVMEKRVFNKYFKK